MSQIEVSLEILEYIRKKVIEQIGTIKSLFCFVIFDE